MKSPRMGLNQPIVRKKCTRRFLQDLKLIVEEIRYIPKEDFM